MAIFDAVAILCIAILLLRFDDRCFVIAVINVHRLKNVLLTRSWIWCREFCL